MSSKFPVIYIREIPDTWCRLVKKIGHVEKTAASFSRSVLVQIGRTFFRPHYPELACGHYCSKPWNRYLWGVRVCILDTWNTWCHPHVIWLYTLINNFINSWRSNTTCVCTRRTIDKNDIVGSPPGPSLVPINRCSFSCQTYTPQKMSMWCSSH